MSLKSAQPTVYVNDDCIKVIEWGLPIYGKTLFGVH